MKWLRNGLTREVFLVGEYAIKLPSFRAWRLFLSGLQANLQERAFSGISEKLCPVLWGDPLGFVIVMPRCSPVPRHHAAAFDEDEPYFVSDEEWGEWINIQGEESQLPVENKCSSFGLLKGKLVAVDYGSGSLHIYLHGSMLAHIKAGTL